MNVTKLRIGADAHGLVPAGAYFERLAGALRDANAREAAEDARLEARYRNRRARYAVARENAAHAAL